MVYPEKCHMYTWEKWAFCCWMEYSIYVNRSMLFVVFWVLYLLTSLWLFSLWFYMGHRTLSGYYSIIYFSLQYFCPFVLHILWWSVIRNINICNYIFLLNRSLHYYMMTFFVSWNLFWFKIYYVIYFAYYCMNGISFSILFISNLFVSLDLKSLVDNIWLDHVFLSILPISIFWLESSIHLYLTTDMEGLSVIVVFICYPPYSFFLPVLWRCNWHIVLHKFKVYSIMVWLKYYIHYDYHSKFNNIHHLI